MNMIGPNDVAIKITKMDYLPNQHRSISLSYKSSAVSVFSKGIWTPTSLGLTQHQKQMVSSKTQSRDEGNKNWDVCIIEEFSF